MPYNFVADSFYTKKLCSRLSSSKVRFYSENGRFAFLSPLWGLWATYNVHLRLTGKRVVRSRLPISVNWSFLLDATAEALRANIDWKSVSLQRGPVDPKFQGNGVVPTNRSSSQRTRLNDLSCGIKIWTDLSSVLSQSARLTDGRAFDGRTDRQTDGHTHILVTRPPCIQCSAAKIWRRKGISRTVSLQHTAKVPWK